MSHGIRNSNSALSDTSQYVLRLPAPTQLITSAKSAPRKMRAASHDVRDGRLVVFVAGTVCLEEAIQAVNARGHGICRLQADGYAVVCEGELDVVKARLPAEIAVCVPHSV